MHPSPPPRGGEGEGDQTEISGERNAARSVASESGVETKSPSTPSRTKKITSRCVIERDAGLTEGGWEVGGGAGCSLAAGIYVSLVTRGSFHRRDAVSCHFLARLLVRVWSPPLPAVRGCIVVLRQCGERPVRSVLSKKRRRGGASSPSSASAACRVLVPKREGVSLVLAPTPLPFPFSRPLSVCGVCTEEAALA
jgi:hypothetical protein